jgi:hypothetical protein
MPITQFLISNTLNGLMNAQLSKILGKNRSRHLKDPQNRFILRISTLYIPERVYLRYFRLDLVINIALGLFH